MDQVWNKSKNVYKYYKIFYIFRRNHKIIVIICNTYYTPIPAVYKIFTNHINVYIK